MQFAATWVVHLENAACARGEILPRLSPSYTSMATNAAQWKWRHIRISADKRKWRQIRIFAESPDGIRIGTDERRSKRRSALGWSVVADNFRQFAPLTISQRLRIFWKSDILQGSPPPGISREDLTIFFLVCLFRTSFGRCDDWSCIFTPRRTWKTDWTKWRRTLARSACGSGGFTRFDSIPFQFHSDIY